MTVTNNSAISDLNNSPRDNKPKQIWQLCSKHLVIIDESIIQKLGINDTVTFVEQELTADCNRTSNFNERTTTTTDYNNTLNQQQDAINKTLDNTLHNIKRTTDEATREIPRYTQRITEYQEQTIQTIKDIASDFIEAEKEAISSFQSQQVDRNSSGNVWDL